MDKNCDKLVKQAAALVRKEPWFRKGNWTLVASSGDWSGLQLSKTNWFNEEGHGIHFETWLSPEVLESGVVQFQAHVMHAGMTFPGTDKKAGALSRPVIARHGELVRSWAYHIPAVPGMGLLGTRVQFQAADFPEIVLRECSRFALLGDTIDELLPYVLEGRKIPAVRGAAKPKTSEKTALGRNLLPPFKKWRGETMVKATIALHPEKDGSLRVEVGGNTSKNHHAIALCDGLHLEEGVTYHASYEVKAAAPRWMTGNIRQPQPPHFNVGTFKGITFTEEWQKVSWEFKAERTEANTCLLFALGKMPNTVWLRNVELKKADS